EVRASDPAGSGHSSKSERLALGNSGPTIVSTPPTAAVQDRFDYSVQARDPDGDQLTYYLEMAPPGMVIGSESGHIGWQIPTDQQGTFHVKVVAKDERGGLATQEFDLILTQKTPSAPPGA
ncbi:MAG: Ig domain-containing protein, partial [Nitrospira sp.]